MDMGILAITETWDFQGLKSVGSIVCLFIALSPFITTAKVSGSGSWTLISGMLSNALFFFIAAVIFAGSGSYIANKSQTKWMEANITSELDVRGSMYIPAENDMDSNGVERFIPTRETYRAEDTALVMLSTDDIPNNDDYYIVGKSYHISNVPKEYGGWGIPQWLWHPGSAIWIFAFFGAPAILGIILWGGRAVLR